ncbi:MAG: helix-turn-helix transcriptional regulator [Thaumarchaeota archaeon]|nr:helix-turn-helix transcriptional regulator [Nitrososphaerota archaeon]
MLEGKYLAAIYADPNHRSCPIEQTFRIVGKRWTVVILRELFFGANRFGRIKSGVGRINPKVLSNRLKELEDFGIIKRSVIPGRPVQIDYSLTEKGSNLLPLLFSAASYSLGNCPEVVFKDGKPYTAKEIFEKTSS